MAFSPRYGITSPLQPVHSNPRSGATDDERKQAVAACFGVAATDHEITAEEYAELTEIGEELGLTRAELNVIRTEYRDQLTAIKQMRQQQAEASAQ